MAIFKIEWVESKPTASGKARKVATLSDPNGAHYENVTIWSDFPNFEGLMAGHTVDGDYKDDGKYRTLYGIRPKPPAGGGAPSGGGGPRGVAAAQTRKAEGIATAQERKEEGIMLAAAFRDATLILVNHPEYSTMSFEEGQSFHKRIRDWYIKEWRATEKSLDVPF